MSPTLSDASEYLDPRKIRVDSRLLAATEDGSLPKQLVVCGAAGTGKTFGVCTWLHLLAAEESDVRILILRKTRASITESVLPTLEDVMAADGYDDVIGGRSRQGRTGYDYPDTGSIIRLGGLDNPTKVMSTAWDVVYINEAIEIEEAAWDALWSRLGRPGRPPGLGMLLGDTNPGDPAHWIRQRADRGELALWDTVHEANPAMFSGGRWTAAGANYRTNVLGRLKGNWHKRLALGLWAAGEGVWFDAFDPAEHVTASAEYDPAYPVHLAIDSGVHTGAVWFQVIGHRVNVFADFYAFHVNAYDVARQILRKHGEHCGVWYTYGTTDPAGRADNAIGPSVLAEYERAGLRSLVPWPVRPVRDGLTLVDSFLCQRGGLRVHPRCQHLVNAFANYKRAQRGKPKQWVDVPEDPQHPYEELMDSLRGGLFAAYPEGRKIAPAFRRVDARKIA